MFTNIDWDTSNDSLQESLLGTSGKKNPKSSSKSVRSSGSVVKSSKKRIKDVLVLGKQKKVVAGKEPERDEVDGKDVKMTKSSLLARKVAKKMSGARFRWINQKLYTCTGSDAAKLFTEEPHLFTVYHEGFSEQVEKWPLNPLDNLIEYIKRSPPESVVADFGCGEARLAQSVSQRVHSFDFVALNEHVTSCDMSRVPLEDSTIDIGVFCLSLMGVNLLEYLIEARRVIKLKGVLKICEIQSRLSSVEQFVEQVESLGFKLRKKMCLNKMFIDFEFVLKNKKKKESGITISSGGKGLSVELKPCLYKKR